MIDFKNTYDSINSKMLIETLIKFKIDKIVNMYANDETTVKLGGMN